MNCWMIHSQATKDMKRWETGAQLEHWPPSETIQEDVEDREVTGLRRQEELVTIRNGGDPGMDDGALGSPTNERGPLAHPPKEEEALGCLEKPTTQTFPKEWNTSCLLKTGPKAMQLSEQPAQEQEKEYTTGAESPIEQEQEMEIVTGTEEMDHKEFERLKENLEEERSTPE